VVGAGVVARFAASLFSKSARIGGLRKRLGLTAMLPCGLRNSEMKPIRVPSYSTDTHGERGVGWRRRYALVASCPSTKQIFHSRFWRAAGLPPSSRLRSRFSGQIEHVHKCLGDRMVTDMDSKPAAALFSECGDSWLCDHGRGRDRSASRIVIYLPQRLLSASTASVAAIVSAPHKTVGVRRPWLYFRSRSTYAISPRGSG